MSADLSRRVFTGLQPRGSQVGRPPWRHLKRGCHTGLRPITTGSGFAGMIMLCAETGPAARAAGGGERPSHPDRHLPPGGLPIRVARPRVAEDDDVSIKKPGGTAIVLGGGGVLGAVQVGMLRALIEAGVRPSLVVGTSVGALNGAVLAALPLAEVADRLEALWGSPDARGLVSAGTLQRLRELVRSGVAVHQPDPLRRAVTAVLREQRIEDLPVTFTCCAAN